MKYIREGRMGNPFSFKTGAVVGTYPTPMLVALFDEGGLDVIPSRAQLAANNANKDLVHMDVAYEDIKWATVAEVREMKTKQPSELPKVTACSFVSPKTTKLDAVYKVAGNSQQFMEFLALTDVLYGSETLPWKTIVVDSLTGYQEAVLFHQAQYNAGDMGDARKWAANVGEKVRQLTASLLSLPAHVVLLLHTNLNKNELTGAIIEEPDIYSKLRNTYGKMFSSFFYSTKVNGKAKIWTSDQGFVKGIGSRGVLPPVCDPDFTSIYGKEITK